jgi:hypothetical protein
MSYWRHRETATFRRRAAARKGRAKARKCATSGTRRLVAGAGFEVPGSGIRKWLSYRAIDGYVFATFFASECTPVLPSPLASSRIDPGSGDVWRRASGLRRGAAGSPEPAKRPRETRRMRRPPEPGDVQEGLTVSATAYEPAELLGPLNDVESKNAPRTLFAAGDVSLLRIGAAGSRSSARGRPRPRD